MRAPVLGIDPGLRAMATAWSPGSEPDQIHLDTIMDGGRKGGPRLVHLRDRFRYVLDEAQPEVAMIEGYSFGSRQGREAQGEIGGVIRVELTERGIDYVEVPPSSLKVWVAGNGTANKARMVNSAQLAQRLAGGSTMPVNDHEADGLGLFWLGVEAGAWWMTPPIEFLVPVVKKAKRKTRPEILVETRSKLPARFLP